MLASETCISLPRQIGFLSPSSGSAARGERQWPWWVVAGCDGGHRGEVGVGLAGYVALETAQDLGLGLAFGGAAGYVVLSGLLAVHPDQGDPPQGAVGVAVPAA